MGSPAPFDHLLRDVESILAELGRLDRRDAELESALRDVEHDSRRSNDALERAGWRSAEAETRGELLADNRKAILSDREKIRAQRKALNERLAVARERLQETDDHA